MMIAYLEANWFGKALISILTFVNSMIYSLVRVFFQIFMNLTETTMFDDTTLQTFTSRIYVVLGVYMLFKFAFSLLSSIVNPDNLVDKEKGMGKIIPRTIIALLMLVMVPDIFRYAMDWQGKLVVTVPKIILGINESSSGDIGDAGDEMASTALRAFFEKNSDCIAEDENLSAEIETETADMETVLTSTDMTLDSTLSLAQQVCGVSGRNQTFRFKFNGFMSLVVGIILIIMLAGYCIDIAMRVIKIGILRLLAPIPIISYIDPKSEKNGAFGNWLKECISTYTEIFIKLTILYFCVFILSGLATDTGTVFVYPTDTNTLGFTKLFLILGVFFFMPKAAEFICNILGIKKPEGSGGLLKGLAGIGAAVGIAGGGISSAVNRYQSGKLADEARGKKPNLLRNLGKGALGFAVGAGMAGQAVATSKGMAKVTAPFKKTMGANAKSMTRAAHGGTMLGDVIDNMGIYFGVSENPEVLQYQVSNEKALVDFWKSKGNTKGKTQELDFTGNQRNGNYAKINGILGSMMGMANPESFVGGQGTLGELLTQVNEKRSELANGTGDGNVTWAGATFNVNDSSLDYLLGEVQLLAGYEAVQNFAADSADAKIADGYYAAAGKKRGDDISIKEFKESTDLKESKLTTLNKK